MEYLREIPWDGRIAYPTIGTPQLTRTHPSIAILISVGTLPDRRTAVRPIEGMAAGGETEKGKK